MTKNNEVILRLNTIKEKDILILKKQDKEKRFVVITIDSLFVELMNEEGKKNLKVFPKNDLLSGKWYIETEQEENSITL